MDTKKRSAKTKSQISKHKKTGKHDTEIGILERLGRLLAGKLAEENPDYGISKEDAENFWDTGVGVAKVIGEVVGGEENNSLDPIPRKTGGVYDSVHGTYDVDPISNPDYSSGRGRNVFEV